MTPEQAQIVVVERRSPSEITLSVFVLADTHIDTVMSCPERDLAQVDAILSGTVADRLVVPDRSG